MKVNDPNNSLSNPVTGSATGPGKIRQTPDTQSVQPGRGKTAGNHSAAGPDDVQLSDLARNLQSLKAALEVDSPAHKARVEQLSKAYAAGSYAVDAEATAGKIIDDGLTGKR